jgi:hypothetical protein
MIKDSEPWAIRSATLGFSGSAMNWPTIVTATGIATLAGMTAYDSL